jgi:hypothetical protein
MNRAQLFVRGKDSLPSDDVNRDRLRAGDCLENCERVANRFVLADAVSVKNNGRV